MGGNGAGERCSSEVEYRLRPVAELRRWLAEIAKHENNCIVPRSHFRRMSRRV